MNNRTYKQVCIDLALGCDLGDGPDSPDFQRDYADSINCLELAFHDNAAAFVDELTPRKLDEIHTALAAFEAAKIGGSIEARDLASRTVAGLVSAHALFVGERLLNKYENDAWESAADCARDAHMDRCAEEGRVW